MPYPWLTTIMVAVFFYGTVICVFTRQGKECVEEAFDYYPKLGLTHLLPTLTLTYLFYSANAGGIELVATLKVVIWLTVPVYLLSKTRNEGSRPTLQDILAAVTLWIPFDLHWVDRRSIAIKNALDWPLLALSMVVICLTMWVCQRRLDGAKTRISFRKHDLSVVLGGTLFLFATLVPLGLYVTNFLQPAKFWETETGTLLEVIANHLFTKTFMINFIKIFVTIGLSEELLFRGIVQNLLDKACNKWASLIMASLLFGAAHLNNGAQSIHPSDWNWTYALFASIAGLTYGTVFRYSSSILYAVLVHSVVDTVWHTFFQ